MSFYYKHHQSTVPVAWKYLDNRDIVHSNSRFPFPNSPQNEEEEEEDARRSLR